jgi:hypothetical protein
MGFCQDHKTMNETQNMFKKKFGDKITFCEFLGMFDFLSEATIDFKWNSSNQS